MNCGPMFPTFTSNNWTATACLVASHVDQAGVESHPRRAATPNIVESLSRLVDLLEENGEDDYGKTGPTQFAFMTAYRMVERAETLTGLGLPLSPTVDSQGGIRISWRQGDKQVKLVCPATPESQMYIYHYQSSTDASSVRNQNVTAEALAERLSWLTNREQQATQRAAG